jgi:NodT family efflux transporter outer membrane factor (OMF) lipoprotein
MPAAWTDAAQQPGSAFTTGPAADLVRWWERFGDPVLTSLVEQSLQANPGLAAAEANLRQARALRGVAAGGLWPALNASASAQRVGGAAYATETSSNNLFVAGLDAVWELDFFGGVRRNVEAADANTQAALENLRDVQVSLAAEVALAYLQLRGDQLQLETARNSIGIQQHTLDIVSRLHKAGLDSGLDEANAQSTLASTEAQVPVYETGARQAIYALGVLLGQHPGALLERLSPSADLPSLPGPITSGLPSDLLRRRPDVRMAEAQLHSATALIGVAEAQLFPQFSLAGSVNWVASQSGAWLTRTSRSYAVGPQANWSIFQGGATVSAMHAQEAARDAALANYQTAVLGAIQDVENALVAFGQERFHCQFLEQAVAADHKAVDLSQVLFQAGQVDFLTVITAQRTLYADDSDLSLRRQNLETDLVALYKALGGGWDTGS